MERIVFPDAAAAVIGALNSQLASLGQAGVEARSHVPNPRPSKFVRIVRTGGPRANIVTDAVQLTYEAWATNEADAHDLAQAARAVIIGLEGTVTGGVTFYGIEEFAGPGFLPDPSSDQARYTGTTSVNVRGAAA